MKRILLFLLSLLVGTVLFVWVIKFVGWQGIKSVSNIFISWQGIAIIILTLITVIIGTWKWKSILGGLGVKVSLKSLIGPYLAGYAVMFLAPIIVWGGEILRSYLLKEKNRINWEKGMASIIIDRILEWTANLIIIFLGIYFFASKIYIFPRNLEIFFGSVFLMFVLATLYFYFKVFKKESIAEAVLKIFGLGKIKEKNTFLTIEKEIFPFLNLKNKSMWNALGISFLRAGFMWFRTWLLVFFVGKSTGGLSALSILGFNYLASMVPIPTALGSHEAIQTVVFGSLGLGRSNAAAFTIIIRGAELLVSFFGVIILFKLGMDFVKRLLFRSIERIANGIRENGNV